MQTTQVQHTGIPDTQRADSHSIAPSTCQMLSEDGLVDLKQESPCETVRALLQELRGYRAARLESGWRLDRLGRTVITGAQRVELTRTQFSIVEVLARANGEFVCVYDILMGVWAFAQPVGGGELVRTHIRAIRRRLRACQVSDDFINGSRGRGYRINPKFAAPTPMGSRQTSSFTGAA